MTNRLKEAIKQIRIVKEEVDDPEVSGELERALEALENAVESLEENEWFVSSGGSDWIGHVQFARLLSGGFRGYLSNKRWSESGLGVANQQLWPVFLTCWLVLRCSTLSRQRADTRPATASAAASTQLAPTYEAPLTPQRPKHGIERPSLILIRTRRKHINRLSSHLVLNHPCCPAHSLPRYSSCFHRLI